VNAQPPFVRLLSLAVTTALAAACSAEDPAISAYREPAADPAELQAHIAAAGLNGWLDQIMPVTLETEGAWDVARFDPAGDARCYDGSPYVASARRGDPKKVALILGGGGGCWDWGTCYGIQIAKDSSDAARDWDGLFSSTNDANPIADWSLVYGDYCDGSVWTGDRDVVYTHPDGHTVPTFHRGLRNLSATVSWMRERHPDPEQILVTGASAGGYGTLMGYMVVRAAWPDHEIVVLNDSGPWLFNPALQEEMLDPVFANWDIPRLLPADCPASCDEQLLFLLDWIMPRDPKLRIGILMHLNDFTIGTGYLGIGLGFPDLLRDTTGRVHAQFPDRFRRYFVEGIKHTSIFDDETYELERDGLVFTDWLAALLAGNQAGWPDLP
jgi:hypothetical protein